MVYFLEMSDRSTTPPLVITRKSSIGSINPGVPPQPQPQPQQPPQQTWVKRVRKSSIGPSSPTQESK